VLQQPIIVDGHIDTPQRMLDMKADISARLPDGHVDVPRMKEGGLTAAFFSIWVDSRYGPGAAFPRALALVGAVQALVDTPMSAATSPRSWGSRGGTRSRIRSRSSIPCTGWGRAT
jgi:hypothetical protein